MENAEADQTVSRDGKSAESFTLLLEYESSKIQLNLTTTLAKLPSVYKQEVRKIVGENTKLVLDVSEQSHDHSRCYLLQRYTTRWNDFVDVSCPTRIDKLHAISFEIKVARRFIH